MTIQDIKSNTLYARITGSVYQYFFIKDNNNFSGHYFSFNENGEKIGFMLNRTNLINGEMPIGIEILKTLNESDNPRHLIKNMFEKKVMFYS